MYDSDILSLDPELDSLSIHEFERSTYSLPQAESPSRAERHMSSPMPITPSSSLASLGRYTDIDVLFGQAKHLREEGDAGSKESDVIPGLFEQMDDEDLRNALNQESVKLHERTRSSDKVKAACAKIRQYMEEARVETVIDEKAMMSELRPASVVVGIVEDLARHVKVGSAAKREKKTKWSRTVLFTSTWLNSLGIDLDTTCRALDLFAEESYNESKGYTTISSLKRKAAERSVALTDKDCHGNKSGALTVDHIESFATKVYEDHLCNRNTVALTKDRLAQMERTRREVMLPKMINVSKLTTEVIDSLVEPDTSRHQFCEFWSMANTATAGEDNAYLVTLKNNGDNATLADSVAKLELSMMGKPYSVQVDHAAITRQVQKLVLPTRFRFKESDSTPLMDRMLDMLGASSSDRVCLHSLNCLDQFDNTRNTTEILQLVKSMEKTNLASRRVTADTDLLAKMKFLMTKMTLFVLWLTVLNVVKPFGSGSEISVGQMDDFGREGKEVVLANWAGRGEVGRDCMKMNEDTVYYNGQFYYMFSPSEEVVYRSEKYRELIALMKQ